MHRGRSPAAVLDCLVETRGLGLLYYLAANQGLAVAQTITNPDVVVPTPARMSP